MPTEAAPAPTAEKPEAIATPPAEQKPVTPAPTPEEIAAKSASFVDSFLGQSAHFKPKKEKPAEEKPAEVAAPVVADEPKPDDAPKPDAEPAPEPESPEIKAAAERSQAEAIAAQTLLSSAINEPEPEPEPTARPEPQQINRADHHKLEVAQAMEQIFPGKYDGLSGQIQEFRKVESDYKRQWIKENPGKKFVESEEEHNEWYSQHEPTWTKGDFEYADRALMEARATDAAEQRAMQKLKPQIDRLEFKQRLDEIAPGVIKSVADAEKSIYDAIPEFKDVIEKHDGVIDKKAHAALAKANPALYDLAVDLTNRDAAVIAELEKMDKLGAQYKINPSLIVPMPGGERIRPHQEISDTINLLEDEWQNDPAKAVRNGKTFLTIEQVGAKRAEILSLRITDQAKQARLDALKKAHFSVTAKDVKDRRIAQTKSRVESFHKKMPTPAKKAAAAIAPKPGETNGTPEPGAAPVKPKPSNGSATVTSSDTIDSRPSGLKSSEESTKKILDTWFKRA